MELYYRIMLRNYITDHGIILRNHIPEGYYGIILRNHLYGKDPWDTWAVPGDSWDPGDPLGTALGPPGTPLGP